MARVILVAEVHHDYQTSCMADEGGRGAGACDAVGQYSTESVWPISWKPVLDRG